MSSAATETSAPHLILLRESGVPTEIVLDHGSLRAQRIKMLQANFHPLLEDFTDFRRSTTASSQYDKVVIFYTRMLDFSARRMFDFRMPLGNSGTTKQRIADGKRLAAARSTGLRPLHFSTAVVRSAVHPLRRNDYRIVMNGKLNV